MAQQKLGPPEIPLTSDHLSRIAFANPGAQIEVDPATGRQYLTLDGLTFVAPSDDEVSR